MKAVEFCYWLQGYYEISNSQLMTPNQLTIVRRHLDMVAIHEKGDGRSVQFCTELRQLLSNGSYFGLAPQLPAETLRAVAKKLNEVFLHESMNPSGAVTNAAVFWFPLVLVMHIDAPILTNSAIMDGE